MKCICVCQKQEPDRKRKAPIVIRTGNVLKLGEKESASGEQVILAELSCVQPTGFKSGCSLLGLRFQSPGRLAGKAAVRCSVHSVFVGPSREKSQFSSVFTVDF